VAAVYRAVQGPNDHRDSTSPVSRHRNHLRWLGQRAHVRARMLDRTRPACLSHKTRTTSSIWDLWPNRVTCEPGRNFDRMNTKPRPSV
jgi:hypothetical protein